MEALDKSRDIGEVAAKLRHFVQPSRWPTLACPAKGVELEPWL